MGLNPKRILTEIIENIWHAIYLGPTIILPSDPGIKEGLEKKLDEYKSRFRKNLKKYRYQSPEQKYSTLNAYKIVILERLLEKGIVFTWNLSNMLYKKYRYLDEDNFNKATSVMEDYCKTGGKNLYGGTGLKPQKDNV